MNTTTRLLNRGCRQRARLDRSPVRHACRHGRRTRSSRSPAAPQGAATWCGSNSPSRWPRCRAASRSSRRRGWRSICRASRNAMGQSLVDVNQGNVRSVNVAQGEARTRLVLNLKQAANLPRRTAGQGAGADRRASGRGGGCRRLRRRSRCRCRHRSAGVAAPARAAAPVPPPPPPPLPPLAPAPAPQPRSRAAAAQCAGATAPVAPSAAAAFAQSQNLSPMSLQNIDFRRGTDGAGRVVVDLPSTQVGVDIKQEGRTLVVDFLRSTVPDSAAPAARRDRLRHAGADDRDLPERRPGAHGGHADRQLGAFGLPERQPVRARGAAGEARSEPADAGPEVFGREAVAELPEHRGACAAAGDRRLHQLQRRDQRFGHRQRHAAPEGRAVGPGARHHPRGEEPRHQAHRQCAADRAEGRTRRQGEARARGQGADRRSSSRCARRRSSSTTPRPRRSRAV